MILLRLIKLQEILPPLHRYFLWEATVEFRAIFVQYMVSRWYHGTGVDPVLSVSFLMLQVEVIYNMKLLTWKGCTWMLPGKCSHFNTCSFVIICNAVLVSIVHFCAPGSKVGIPILCKCNWCQQFLSTNMFVAVSTIALWTSSSDAVRLYQTKGLFGIGVDTSVCFWASISSSVLAFLVLSFAICGPDFLSIVNMSTRVWRDSMMTSAVATRWNLTLLLSCHIQMKGLFPWSRSLLHEPILTSLRRRSLKSELLRWLRCDSVPVQVCVPSLRG